MRLLLTIVALLTPHAAAQVLAVNVYTGSSACGGTPASTTVTLGCTTLGATSASFTLAAGLSPAAYTYSLYYASPTCSGAPDVTFTGVPADGATCVSNAVGNANVPANSASIIAFSVPSAIYAMTGFEVPGCAYAFTLEPASLSLSLGCSDTEGVIFSSDLSASLIPVPNTSPVLFNYSQFTALGCAAGTLDVSFLLAADSFTCFASTIAPEFFGPNGFSARLFPVPSREFAVSYFGSASCTGERGTAAHYDLGCHGPFGNGSYLSLAPELARSPYATPIAYNVSLYQGPRGGCRRTEVKTRWTAFADGSCVSKSLSTTQDQVSLRFVVFPTPPPPPTPEGAQALTAGAIAAIVLGVVLACCIAGAAYAFLRGIVTLRATQKAAPPSTTYVTTVPSWLQPAKDVGGAPPAAPPAFALAPPPPLPNAV